MHIRNHKNINGGSKMKKIISIICALVFCVFAFAGCSSKSATTTAATTEATTAAATEATTAAATEAKTDDAAVVTLVYDGKSTSVSASDFSAKSQTQTITDPNLGKTYDFVGVTLADLMEMAGAKDCTSIKVACKDNMSTTIAAEDAAQYPIMIANAYADGKSISAGAGGPVKLVFPYDQYPDLKDKYAAETWMWYVTEIDFTK